jgi:hypothetical protein
MNQFEYNDLDKFYVSIGVFLIGLTFLLPWLFFRESFDLQIKFSDLNTYTDTAQHILKQRQAISSWFSIIVLIGSSLSLILGLILSLIGIKGWNRLHQYNKQMDLLKMENQQLKNKKLSFEIERPDTAESASSNTTHNENETNKTFQDKSFKTEDSFKDFLSIPINNAWVLNHWGSDIASIHHGKIIFKGLKTRLETDGCHISLTDILKLGHFYKVSCTVKAVPNTTGKFQLWCHDNIGLEPKGSDAAIPYITPTIESVPCSLRFEAKFNTHLRIHLQYMPGEGQIEVSDVRITELNTD